MTSKRESFPGATNPQSNGNESSLITVIDGTREARKLIHTMQKISYPAVFVILACFLNCVNVQAAEADKPQTPNIILILADDLGYGEIGPFGQQHILTPNLDRMAIEGMRFTQHYSGSTVCAPSRVSLLTGKNTGNVRIRGNGNFPMDDEEVTLAEILKPAGYATAVIGKWDSGEIGSTGDPLNQGFDYQFGYMHQIDAHNFYPDHLWRNGQRVDLDNEVFVVERGYARGKGTYSTVRNEYSHDLFMEDAFSWITDHQDQPFFLFLPLTIPHANNEHYNSPDEHGMEVPDLHPYEDRDWPTVQKATAAMVTRMDTGIGELMRLLKSLGIAENTLILFTSDNGPHQEGGNQLEFFDTNGPLRGMKRDLYEGGIRVPFLAWWPGTISPGKTSEHISAFWDYLPTFADLSGQPMTSETNGISFLPTLLGEKQKAHEYLYWEFIEGPGTQAVRWGPWKAIRTRVHGYGFEAQLELYNLDEDPGETANLAYDRPDKVEEAKAILSRARVPSDLFKFSFERN